MTRLPVLTRAAFDAYDHLTLPVWVFSVETLRILWANSAARDWVGYDLQALQGMTVADLRPKADRAGVAERVRQFSGTKADAGTWTVVAKSGDHYRASFTWSKVTLEGSEAVVASIRDVTQIARAEAEAQSLSEESRIWQPGEYFVQSHLYWGYVIFGRPAVSNTSEMGKNQ